jgi:hypothetical protein
MISLVMKINILNLNKDKIKIHSKDLIQMIYLEKFFNRCMVECMMIFSAIELKGHIEEEDSFKVIMIFYQNF